MRQGRQLERRRRKRPLVLALVPVPVPVLVRPSWLLSPLGLVVLVAAEVVMKRSSWQQKPEMMSMAEDPSKCFQRKS
jgi:hypothetical protein